MADLYRVKVLGGWSKTVQAESVQQAKTEALRLLRGAGHTIRPLNKDGGESYLFEDKMNGPLVIRRAEVIAIKL